MKKFLVSLLALVSLSLVFAQSFTVGGQYDSQLGLGIVAEYGHPVEFGEVLLGVRVVPVSWATEVSVGVLATVAEVDGAVLSVPVRIILPVYDGNDFLLGQLAASVGLELYVPSETSAAGLVFSGGVRSNVNRDLMTVPGFYAGVGLRF